MSTKVLGRNFKGNHGPGPLDIYTQQGIRAMQQLALGKRELIKTKKQSVGINPALANAADENNQYSRHTGDMHCIPTLCQASSQCI